MKNVILMALMFLLTLSFNAQNKSSQRPKPKPVKTLYKSEARTITTTNMGEEMCFRFLDENANKNNSHEVIIFKDKATLRNFFNKVSEIQASGSDQSLNMSEYVINEDEVKLVKSNTNTYIYVSDGYTTITQPVLDRILKKIRS